MKNSNASFEEEELNSDNRNSVWNLIKTWVLNKYILFILAFLVWMTFLDSTSFLVVRDLNREIDKYQQQLHYYKSEYEKNDAFYKRLMENKDEKEKYARENYFMKKPDEEIFILVVDSSAIKNQKVAKK